MKKTQKGFTLLEIIIVIGILALLLTIIAPEFSGFIQSSKSSMAYSNAEILYNHIDELLYTDMAGNQLMYSDDYNVVDDVVSIGG